MTASIYKQAKERTGEPTGETVREKLPFRASLSTVGKQLKKMKNSTGFKVINPKFFQHTALKI
jgi:hypothetical protein